MHTGSECNTIILSPKPSTMATSFDIGRKLEIGVGNNQFDQNIMERNFNFEVGRKNEQGLVKSWTSLQEKVKCSVSKPRSLECPRGTFVWANLNHTLDKWEWQCRMNMDKYRLEEMMEVVMEMVYIGSHTARELVI